MKKKPRKLQRKLQQENKIALIIEDNESLIKRVKRRLEENGFNVWTVHSFEQALSYLDFEIDDRRKIVVIFLSKNNKFSQYKYD
ncbi:MAG: hypothetical protein WBC21_02165 [Minisyncoccales bacterium]